ncbi:MAG: hypothetical protein JWL64_2703 [Frankiales bacterium]|nr:hypothetical protein [Frankiales bacterium]
MTAGSPGPHADGDRDPPQWVANLTNRTVEDAAITFVIAQEAAEGRTAADCRHRGAAGDVVSGDRIIEVKAFGTSGRGADLWLEVRQVDEARANPHFWLYLVENVRQGDPTRFTLMRIGADDLATLLHRARERRYYEVPLPVGVYDRLAREQRG